MAGHSQFKNIMHRKGAQDKKRARLFTKILREITAAVRNGLPDPEANPRLRAAVHAARHANIPKERIDHAIHKYSSQEGKAAFEEIRYEAHAKHGVALMIDILTDNRNRTAAEIRVILHRHGASLGESGSASYLFHKRGVIVYDVSSLNYATLFEQAVNLGAEDYNLHDGDCEISCSVDNFHHLKDELEKSFGPAKLSVVTWDPISPISLNETDAEEIHKLIEELEEHEDVQEVVTNLAAS